MRTARTAPRLRAEAVLDARKNRSPVPVFSLKQITTVHRSRTARLQDATPLAQGASCHPLLGRRGSRNSDSKVCGSLASPTPPRGGRRKERGDEANETESWGDLQGAGRVGASKKRQDAGRVARAIQRPLWTKCRSLHRPPKRFWRTSTQKEAPTAYRSVRTI
jgi:hypothetical protein